MHSARRGPSRAQKQAARGNLIAAVIFTIISSGATIAIGVNGPTQTRTNDGIVLGAVMIFAGVANHFKALVTVRKV